MYEEEESASMITEKFQNENSDRLSDLPDELIVSMLSHLTAKEVAQTCLLSKRWRNLWAHVPSLCFDILDFNGDKDRYKKFVTNFLLKRDGATATHIFRILCDRLDIEFSDNSFPEVSEWINYAVAHNPKSVEMNFIGTAGFCSRYIPECLFNCKTLEDLTLNVPLCKREEIKPNTVYLPRLRNLNLINVNLGSYNLEKILSGCPILEDLRMEDCALKMSSFSCHCVKRLQVLGPEIFQETISISVPCVENLIFRGDMDYSIILKDTRMVTQAILLDASFVDQEKYTCHTFIRLSSVEKLEISSSFIEETLKGRMPKCPTFHNLKSLSIHEISVCCDFDAWSSFIMHCPNLEELYFKPLEELCEVHEEHEQVLKHQNLGKTEGFPCKDLKKVGIVCRQLCYSVRKLSRLIKQRTKEINDVKIVFHTKSV